MLYFYFLNNLFLLLTVPTSEYSIALSKIRRSWCRHVYCNFFFCKFWKVRNCIFIFYTIHTSIFKNFFSIWIFWYKSWFASFTSPCPIANWCSFYSVFITAMYRCCIITYCFFITFTVITLNWRKNFPVAENRGLQDVQKSD